MAGEAEYAFWHVLARDVAYNQLPRASRATRHVAAASWIESKAPERVEDLADVLAYHYATALELARAAGETRAGRRAGGTRPALPRPRRGTRPRPRHRRRPRELRAGARAHSPAGTPNGPRRSPASARPPSTPDATARRRRRWRRRSPPSRRRATFVPPLGRWACSAPVLNRSRIRGGGSSPPRRSPCSNPCQQARSWSARSPSSPAPRRCRGGTRLASATPSRRSPWREELGLRAARPRPRLPRPGPRQPRRPWEASTTPGGDHARHPGRTGPRGRPAAQQPRLCALRGRRPRRDPGGSTGGDRLRPGPRSHRDRPTALTANTVETLIATGEHEQALALASELAAELRGERERARPHHGAESCRPQILTLRGQAAQVGRHARLAGNHQPRGRSSPSTSSPTWARPPSPAPPSDSTTRPPPCSPRSRPTPAAARPRTTPPPARDGAHRTRRSATRNSPNGSWPVSNARTPYHEHALAAVNAALAEGPRRPRGRRRRVRRRRQPLAGVRGRSRASVRPARPRPQPHRPSPNQRGQARCSSRPARSSRSSRQPPPSLKPTSSCSRRPRSAPNRRLGRHGGNKTHRDQPRSTTRVRRLSRAYSLENPDQPRQTEIDWPNFESASGGSTPPGATRRAPLCERDRMPAAQRAPGVDSRHDAAGPERE